MSTSTNAGDKTRKEIPTKLGVSEEEINKHIANWAADRDSKGNIIPGTEGKTIAVMCGAPYFTGNVKGITDNEANGTSSDTASSAGVTVIDEGEQGTTYLKTVLESSITIKAFEAKKKDKEKEVEEDKSAEKDEK